MPLTIAQALVLGRNQLSESASPELDARLLLRHVLGRPHSYLIGHADEELTEQAAHRYRNLLDRAAQKEPIPYLTGWAPFLGLEFAVSPAVLIPRPETELLVEAALSWAAGRAVHGQGLVVVDVGTGSGCLAVTLARGLAGAKVLATDISAAALAVARGNATRHDVADQIDFYEADLLEPIQTRPDLIVANLPYIADHEWTAVDDGVKWYEPGSALRAGPDGLAVIRPLLDQAAEKLAPDGAIFLEIGWQQGPAVDHLAQRIFPSAQVEIRPDYAGHDRIVAILLDRPIKNNDQ